MLGREDGHSAALPSQYLWVWAVTGRADPSSVPVAAQGYDGDGKKIGRRGRDRPMPLSGVLGLSWQRFPFGPTPIAQLAFSAPWGPWNGGSHKGRRIPCLAIFVEYVIISVHIPLFSTLFLFDYSGVRLYNIYIGRIPFGQSGRAGWERKASVAAGFDTDGGYVVCLHGRRGAGRFRRHADG